MKKVILKKAISFITVFAMSCSITTSSFAKVENVLLDGKTTRTATGTLTNGVTKINKEQGKIDENGTDTFQIEKENPAEYLFKSTDGKYTYSLLDKDEEGNYFIMTADRYGQVTFTNSIVNNVFDPDPESTNSAWKDDINFATWLNGDFYNGTETQGTITAKKSLTTIDSVIKDYIVDHTWVTEGNNTVADEAKHITDTTKTDYSVTCKIALPSESEYIKYSDKIGYSSTQYIDNGLTTASMILLRSPNKSAANVYRFSEKDGNISGSIELAGATSFSTAFMRPCFYVNKDYFKETRLTSYGSAVKSVLSKELTKDELKALGYTDAEIADIKGSVITDDMNEYDDTDVTYTYDEEGNIKTKNIGDNWVAKKLATQDLSASVVAYPEGSTDNKAMSIGYNTYVYRQLTTPAESGILTLEADIAVNGGNFGIGIIESGKSNIQGKAYPVFIGNGQSKLSAIINKSADNYNVSKESIASYYRSYNKDNDGNDEYMTFSNEQQFHLKLIIDAKTGECSVMIGDKLSKTIDIPYLGTDTEGNAAIGGITFMNRNSANAAYVDNVKISYDSRGSIISGVFTGNNTIVAALRYEATLDEAQLTNDSVTLKTTDGTALPVTAVQLLENGDLKIKTLGTMTAGTAYCLDIPALAAYHPITNLLFTHTDGVITAEAEITDAKYASGETAKASCTINTSAFSAKKVELYLAAYKGDRMTDVSIKEIDITEDDFGEITDTIELQLTEEADCIRAFVWDEKQIPYNTCAEAINAN